MIRENNFFLLMLTLAAAILLLGSCRSVRYVEVPSVHVEHSKDTLLRSDSVWIEHFTERLLSGDTVINNNVTKEYHYHNTYVSQRDTVRDTIPKPYPVDRPVEKEKGWWERFLLQTGAVVWLLFILFIIIKVSKQWKN